MTCAPEQMVNAPYLDPDGTEVFCANTEIGDALRPRRTRARRGAGGSSAASSARGRAHFELGGRTRDPAVTREHVLVD